MRQEGILLRLVEAMDLVDEEDGFFGELIAPLGRLGHDVADVLDPGPDRRDLPKARAHAASQKACQRGLPGAGWAPQNQRRQGALAQGALEQAARAQEMALPDELLERARTHALGQRLAHVSSLGPVREKVHSVLEKKKAPRGRESNGPL